MKTDLESSIRVLTSELVEKLQLSDTETIDAVARALKAASDLGKKEAHQQQIYLNHLMEHLPDRIYFKDLQSRFVAGNRAFIEYFGMENSEEVIGKSDFDFFPPHLARQKFDDEQQIIHEGKTVRKDEHDEQIGGHFAWSSTTKMPLLSDEGAIIGTFGLSRDITDKKLAEDKLIALAEALQMKNDQIELDLEMARRLQTAFLPTGYPSFMWDIAMDDSALRFAHLYLPSTKLAGDFFQVVPISNKKAGVLICDVMGHGIRASLVTGILRGLVGELKLLTPYPHVFLRKVNRSLNTVLKQLDITLFVTAFYAVIDLERGMLHYANAGHPLPVKANRPHGSVEVIPLVSKTPEPALGLMEVFKYNFRSIPIEAGDSLYLFTDGLIESENHESVQFGLDRLIAWLRTHQKAECSLTLDALISEIQSFSGTSSPHDDICMIGIDIEKLAYDNREDS